MSVSMISKSLRLLSLIGEATHPPTFSELVTHSDLSKSTVHRLLGMMMDEGMVRFHESMKVYLLGRRAFDMLKQAHSGYDVQALALEGMLHLRRQTRHNVSIAVVDGDFAVVLRAFDADTSFGRHNRPGLREPLHVCAAGKALVAHMPAPVFDAKFENYDYFARSAQTITSPGAFRDDLEAVRRRGYATCDREEYDYICGIAAPIFNFVGDVIAAINIWNTTDKATLVDLEHSADALMEVTGEVTQLIGGVGQEV